ncbi:glycoside hydrolase family 9 protein [Pseudochryseolinea flava]|uniref:Glycoside hydrolase n=1 Tax=Pseudochryseolinea flava TaxID=2059302 RepID=A0A364XXE7_9BACT|nr:glycoside hydrolase family 9 protein [Pseudochryseolinea flava]RAV98894.1 glycoside hydrolase [Pseudochryseolinea flava]
MELRKFLFIATKSIALTLTLLLSYDESFTQDFKINEQDYFETRGANILVFSNEYNGMFFDEKTAGIEFIHHGVRNVTGGAVRLQNTPEQWDLVPKLVQRKVDKKNNSIDVELRYNEFDFNSKVKVKAENGGIVVSVFLDKMIPENLEGQAGFNLELIPSPYFEKTYLMDGRPGIFPLYPAANTRVLPASKKISQFAGHKTFDDRGKDEFISADALATGRRIVISPEDIERQISIQSDQQDLMLFDGRNLAQNGCFIIRSLLPSKKVGEVLRWFIKLNVIADWKRSPVIGLSQVGYHPNQEKVSIIELDEHDAQQQNATLFQVMDDGKAVKKFTGQLKSWGKYLRYNYVKFDFSSVKDPGVYFIEYGASKSNTFIIDVDVYKDTWAPTLDVWFPVQMDHMQVNEGYRVWHGVPYLDDALQAPPNHEHFDGYNMSSTTDTKFKPLERIPGLAVGGWFDAGDFDIQTLSHCSAILSFVNTWENFKLDRDQTYIDQATRFVDIHRPDGKADILQQIEHGTLNIVAQIKSIGHPVRGIIVPNLHQYHHLGDASTETDNLPYNPSLKPFQSDGRSSGTMDDRWVFTNRMPFLDYYSAATLAAAHRALNQYNKALADESLTFAKKLWDEARAMPNTDTLRGPSFFRKNAEMNAALQLFITTKDEKYGNRFKELIWSSLDGGLQFSISIALQACPYMDSKYKQKLREYVLTYKKSIDDLAKENPYGVPMTARGWGGNFTIVNWALTNYRAHQAFPDIISAETVYTGLSYIFGCHPYSNLSFVSAVGVKSKRVTYGSNRADFSYIAGGVVPGLLILKPDFPENKEDWPFLWGENEVVIDICAAYIFLSRAVHALATQK